MSNIEYKTTDLEIASFLKANKQIFLGVELMNNLIEFIFFPETESAAEGFIEDFICGAELSANELFEAHRNVKTLIRQVREHFSQIRTEKDGTSSGTENN